MDTVITLPDPPNPSNQPPFDLSIVIPVFNEEDRIGQSLDEVLRFCADHDFAAEIIVVNDGSTDRTACVIESLTQIHDNMVAVQVPHVGKAGAVLAGLNVAQGSIVGFADADIATPLDTWFKCRDALATGADVAIASREGIGSHRLGEPWYRHAMGRVFNGLVRTLLLPGIQDTQCGFKFYASGHRHDFAPLPSLSESRSDFLAACHRLRC